MHNNRINIDGVAGYQRDMATHAVININNSEYESFVRQKNILKSAKSAAAQQAAQIESMSKDIEQLKAMIQTLLNKDTNGSSTTPQ